MNLTTLTVGPIGTNCYIVYHEDAGTALVIDPGEEAERILARLEALKRKPAAILLTHFVFFPAFIFFFYGFYSHKSPF